MKRFVHSVEAVSPSSKISGFQEDVLQEQNPDSRERKLLKAMTSLLQEEDVINKYKVTRQGRNFKINFNDGRKIIWSIDNLPVDWLDVLWDYGTTQRRVMPVGYAVSGESGSLFDSFASITIKQ